MSIINHTVSLNSFRALEPGQAVRHNKRKVSQLEQNEPVKNDQRLKQSLYSTIPSKHRLDTLA